MKRFIVVAVAIAMVLVLTAATNLAPQNPFHGHWTGTDGDGSKLTFTFDEQSRSGGRVYELKGTDDVCGACGGAPALMIGIGVLESENVIHSTEIWWGVPSGDPLFYFLEGNYTYDPGTDTITDGNGLVFERGN